MCATTKYCKSSPGGSACSTVKKTNFASALLPLLHGHPNAKCSQHWLFWWQIKSWYLFLANWNILGLLITFEGFFKNNWLSYWATVHLRPSLIKNFLELAHYFWQHSRVGFFAKARPPMKVSPTFVWYQAKSILS